MPDQIKNDASQEVAAAVEGAAADLESTILGVSGVYHTARVPHHCHHYFRNKSEGCAGTGTILLHEKYWSPNGDFRGDSFHPYRVCMTCVKAALAKEGSAV